MVIDWQGGAVHMTYITNTCIIVGIQYVELMAQVTTGLVFWWLVILLQTPINIKPYSGASDYWASILMTCDTSTDTY